MSTNATAKIDLKNMCVIPKAIVDDMIKALHVEKTILGDKRLDHNVTEHIREQALYRIARIDVVLSLLIEATS